MIRRIEHSFGLSLFGEEHKIYSFCSLPEKIERGTERRKKEEKRKY